MGLKIVPERDSIILFKKAESDNWGINSVSDVKEELKCFVIGSENSTAIESAGGKMVNPTYDISFNNKVNIEIGDIVEVEGRKLPVLTRAYKKDLSQKVLITKISV